MGIVTLGTLARLIATILIGDSLRFVDEGIYLDAARRLMSGDGFAAGYANFPAYPVLVAIFSWPWPDNILVIRGVQALVAGVGAVLVILLAKRLFGLSAAVGAALVYALDPLLVVSASLLYPEAMAALLFTAMLLAAWSASTDGGLCRAALAGLALGVLIQFRPVALALLPVIVLWTAWAVARSPARRLLHAAVVGVCCLAALAPWTVRNLRLHGDVVPASTRGLADGRVATGQIAKQGLVAALLARMSQDPAGFAAHVAREFGHFWEFYPTRLATDDAHSRAELHHDDPRLPVDANFDTRLRDVVSALTFGAELALAMLGVATSWRRKPKATVLLLGMTLAYSLGFALFVGKLRYRIVVLPCVAVFAGVGMVALATSAGLRPVSRGACD